MPSANKRKVASAAQSLAWSDPSLRFSSAPVEEDQLADGLSKKSAAAMIGAEDALTTVRMGTDQVSDCP